MLLSEDYLYLQRTTGAFMRCRHIVRDQGKNGEGRIVGSATRQ